jgi:hypothetical protein
VDQRKFKAFARKFQDEQLKVLESKTRDYAHDADQLANLRGTPGIRPEQALVIHMWKQFVAVCKWAEDPSKKLTQEVRERLSDIANYCILGAALAEELSPLATADRIAQLVQQCHEQPVTPLQEP